MGKLSLFIFSCWHIKIGQSLRWNRLGNFFILLQKLVFCLLWLNTFNYTLLSTCPTSYIFLLTTRWFFYGFYLIFLTQNLYNSIFLVFSLSTHIPPNNTTRSCNYLTLLFGVGLGIGRKGSTFKVCQLLSKLDHLEFKVFYEGICVLLVGKGDLHKLVKGLF